MLAAENFTGEITFFDLEEYSTYDLEVTVTYGQFNELVSRTTNVMFTTNGAGEFNVK